MFLAQTLGDTSGLPVSHSDIPFRRAPRYLRLTSTAEQALDYAAGGFHVSVSRAESGGCDDLATDISPTRASTCKLPLNRDDARQAWINAAIAYSEAYRKYGTAEAPSFDAMLQLLDQANVLADRAYALEGVEPPRDPVKVAAGLYAPAEPVKKFPTKLAAGIGLAAVAVAGGLTYASQKRGGFRRLFASRV